MGFFEDLERPGSWWHLVKAGARIHPLEALLMYTAYLGLLSQQTYDLAVTNAMWQLALFIPVVQIPAFITSRLSYVDIGWPTGLVLMAVICFTQGEGYYYRRLMCCGCLLIHGGRMAFGALILFFPYVFKKDLPRYEYAKVRFLKQDGMPESWWSFKIQHDTLQQCFANIGGLSAPFLLMATNPTPELSTMEIAGAVMWVCCSIGENMADGQMMLFRKNLKPDQKRAVIGCAPFDTKQYFLWTLCRHPNYFFEWMCWNSFCIMAIPSALSLQGSLAMVACLINLLMVSRLFYDCLMYWTGAEPAEYSSAQKRAEYRKHQETTRVFFPIEVPFVNHHRVAGWPKPEEFNK